MTVTMNYKEWMEFKTEDKIRYVVDKIVETMDMESMKIDEDLELKIGQYRFVLDTEPIECYNNGTTISFFKTRKYLVFTIEYFDEYEDNWVTEAVVEDKSKKDEFVARVIEMINKVEAAEVLFKLVTIIVD